ncbi:hypothetical protein DPMN_053030 [Dreissena polymorpha]|uniref:SEC63 domain-containing protein n=1 Tax=Dreissena polymorpha TaxID=45954 RepID=A0A9D4HQC5_DREPO|nr:hypothetical protein DPMN_053030 [Dreissena polymorpha]
MHVYGFKGGIVFLTNTSLVLYGFIFQKNDSKAHAPRFPKPKDEGWFLIVGDVQNKELVALKRVPYIRGNSSVQLSLFMPEKPGRVIYTVYLMSDSYLGLDQQYDLHLEVTEPSIEAQVNMELRDELKDLDFGVD